MTIHVELENGKSAELREPATLTNGQRRPIVAASRKFLNVDLDPQIRLELQRAVARKDTERQNELLTAIQIGLDESAPFKVGEVTITVLVESWTLDLPVPSEQPVHDDQGVLIGSSVLEEISAWDYDRLQRAAGEILPQINWSEPSAGKAPRSTRSKKH